MNIIIDATTQGSGGGRRHLKEILKYISRPNEFSISKIYIWGPRSILSIIPDNNIIEKKTAKLLNYGILGVLIWQIFFRDRCFKSCSFDCIFSPFGNSISIELILEFSISVIIFLTSSSISL